MKHRHLLYPAGTPAERLPLAALVDVLDRGDLDDWRPIAAAVARDPHGPFAERLLRLVDAYPTYGTSPLWRAFVDRCRARAEGTPPSAAVALGALRRRAGLTQVEVAARLGISQSDVSKLERRRDLRLSTLRAYAKALGLRLETVAASGDARTAVRVGPP